MGPNGKLLRLRARADNSKSWAPDGKIEIKYRSSSGSPYRLMLIDEYGRLTGDNCDSDIWYTKKTGHRVITNVQDIRPHVLCPEDKHPEVVSRGAPSCVPKLRHIRKSRRIRLPKVFGKKVDLSRLLYPGGAKVARNLHAKLPQFVRHTGSDNVPRVLKKANFPCDNRRCDECKMPLDWEVMPMFTDVRAPDRSQMSDADDFYGPDFLKDRDYDICAFCLTGNKQDFPQ